MNAEARRIFRVAAELGEDDVEEEEEEEGGHEHNGSDEEEDEEDEAADGPEQERCILEGVLTNKRKAKKMLGRCRWLARRKPAHKVRNLVVATASALLDGNARFLAAMDIIRSTRGKQDDSALCSKPTQWRRFARSSEAMKAIGIGRSQLGKTVQYTLSGTMLVVYTKEERASLRAKMRKARFDIYMRHHNSKPHINALNKADRLAPPVCRPDLGFTVWLKFRTDVLKENWYVPCLVPCFGGGLRLPSLGVMVVFFWLLCVREWKIWLKVGLAWCSDLGDVQKWQASLLCQPQVLH